MVYIPVSVGELIDKLSILKVKQYKIIDLNKLEYINKEYELLFNISKEWLSKPLISELYNNLIIVNNQLWEIEDSLRILEKKLDWGERFIELARKVYFTNDRRFELKNEINKLTNSSIQEQKEYIKYK